MDACTRKKESVSPVAGKAYLLKLMSTLHTEDDKIVPGSAIVAFG